MADCPEKSVLITYLYGEGSTGEHARVEAHVTACRACSEELASLRSVQGALSAWTVPETDLAFDRWQVAPAQTSGAAHEARARESFWSGWSMSPAWGLGVAATLCVAVGATAAAITGFEVRYGDFEFSMGRPAAAEGTAPLFGEAGPPPRVTDIVLAPPRDVFGPGLEFALVGGDSPGPGDPAAMLDRLTVFSPASSAALLEEIQRQMAERELAPEPAWPDIVQRLRRAQERNPARVRQDFADFVVRVAGPPGEAPTAAPGR